MNDLKERKLGSASLCRAFLEHQGWAALFDIATAKPVKRWATNGFTKKSTEVVRTPDFADQVNAIRLIAAYGLGRPAELAASDDSGRTVTDLILSALRPQGVPGVGAE